MIAMLVLLGIAFTPMFAPSAPLPARAAAVSYGARLSGPAESPPNTSPGTGFAQVDFDPAAHTLRVQVSFGGLQGPTTASHIHACTPTPRLETAGVATQVPTFVNFPLGVTSGTYDHTFDTLDPATYNPAFVTANGGTAAGAETRLTTCIAAGRAYLNVHSSVFPGGEIRGFLEPTARIGAKTARFGLPGDPIDPPAGAGGGTRDRVDPPSIIIKSGEAITYENQGAPHRVAIYDSGLTKNGTAAPTTLADIAETAGTGTFLDDPAGRLLLAAPGEDVTWTFTNTSGALEQYLVICAFRPHFADYGMSQVILVMPADDRSRPR
jgi:plastocyanin